MKDKGTGKIIFKGMEGLTVKELKEYLNQCPDDIPVVGFWEGITVPIQEICIVTLDTGERELWLDVD